MTEKKAPLVFTKEFTKQEPIPEEGIERAVELLRSGRLHRYNTAAGEQSEAAVLEKEFADYLRTRYCVALCSCGSAIYVALKCAGVKPGDEVLCNAFTLAPVPGALENAGATSVLVECTDGFHIDLDDLERKAATGRARYFLLSHMRGHVADMERISQICERHGLTMIEDCAHTMGASWNGRPTGTFGLIGCFSTQTYKHINSGEGGLLVTNDPEAAAKAILYSGSYMLYGNHISRPPLEVFDQLRYEIPNFSLRMSNLQAALIRPQLRLLDSRIAQWNERYRFLEAGLNEIPHVRIPVRPQKEQYVGSSIQFTLRDVTISQAESFVQECRARGVAVMWFGRKEPEGYTSRYQTWHYLDSMPTLEQTDGVLDFMCDMRIPLTFSLDDCRVIVNVLADVMAAVVG